MGILGDASDFNLLVFHDANSLRLGFAARKLLICYVLNHGSPGLVVVVVVVVVVSQVQLPHHLTE